jgi:hypothetical protein
VDRCARPAAHVLDESGAQYRICSDFVLRQRSGSFY